MRDFTLDIYETFLKTAVDKGYSLISYQHYIENLPGGKFIILRHDVDDLPGNSLATAVLENKLGAHGSYYFRVVKQSFHPETIKRIKELGHEIGYHYEDMALNNGNLDNSFEHFKKWLNEFRKLAPIKTICMHGSPLSKWDNRLLWTKYDYKSLDIIAEPYFDTNFNKVLYLSDTGRKWNNTSASVRDKVQSSLSVNAKTTFELIELLKKNELPHQVMINIHPQRWTNNSYFWTKELLVQNLKNVAKTVLIKFRKK